MDLDPVPDLVKELAKGVSSKAQSKKPMDQMSSYIEQYNACVRDLLNSNRKASRGAVRGLPSTIEKHPKYKTALKHVKAAKKLIDKVDKQEVPDLKSQALKKLFDVHQSQLEACKGEPCVL